MAFFDSLRRLFGGAGQNGRSGDTTSPVTGGSPTASGSTDEAAVAMIPCEEASARLFEYLDGELEDVSEEEVRRHLEVCEACYPRVQFEKHFLKALQRSQNGGPASGSLRERVLQALAEDERAD